MSASRSRSAADSVIGRRFGRPPYRCCVPRARRRRRRCEPRRSLVYGHPHDPFLVFDVEIRPRRRVGSDSFGRRGYRGRPRLRPDAVSAATRTRLSAENVDSEYASASDGTSSTTVASTVTVGVLARPRRIKRPNSNTPVPRTANTRDRTVFGKTDIPGTRGRLFESTCSRRSAVRIRLVTGRPVDPPPVTARPGARRRIAPRGRGSTAEREWR